MYDSLKFYPQKSTSEKYRVAVLYFKLNTSVFRLWGNDFFKAAHKTGRNG